MQSTDAGKSTKKFRGIQRSAGHHWVGDGFPVQTLFAYPSLGSVLSPFLLLDYAGPAEFSPTGERRGVGAHPHRGFETVAIVCQGEVEHRDSSGGGGSIGPGDVQWMTAASGLVHEEFHGRDFARTGGTLEMVQLRVNLPAKDKMGAPRYQGILNKYIPTLDLPDNHGTVRVIAGEYAGVKGPAYTHTPMHVWDLQLAGGRRTDLALPDGYATALVVLKGGVRVDDSEVIVAAEVGLFDRAGSGICIDSTQEGARALLLCGQPIHEPIVGQGPLVMNTPQEIRQALVDYQNGKMGHLT